MRILWPKLILLHKVTTELVTEILLEAEVNWLVIGALKKEVFISNGNTGPEGQKRRSHP